jgi:U4/U6.U5 tri-snRNP-associated protein 1
MASTGQEEISLSVDETNALRAKLGLKPLNLGPSKRDGQDLPLAEPVSKSEDEKIKKEKEDQKRLADSISSGGGVLDVFGDSGSTEDWLSRQVKKVRESTEENDDSESSSNSSESEASSDSDDSNSK